MSGRRLRGCAATTPTCRSCCWVTPWVPGPQPGPTPEPPTIPEDPPAQGGIQGTYVLTQINNSQPGQMVTVANPDGVVIGLYRFDAATTLTLDSAIAAPAITGLR